MQDRNLCRIEIFEVQKSLKGRHQDLSPTMTNHEQHKFYDFLYQLLEVPRGPWRSGNVSERLWDVLELLYIEFFIKIRKKTLKKTVVLHETPSKSTFFRFDYTDLNLFSKAIFLD